jgi:hypothetical protein
MFTERREPERCAFCHDRFLGPGSRSGCEGCGTVLHDECWELTEGCPTLGCARAQDPRSRVPPAPWTFGHAIVNPGVAVAVLCLVALFLRIAGIRAREHAKESACENDLQQIALAAMQYADDKRFFPHVQRIQEVDGDASTSDGPRALRSLVYFNYLDSPETFCCPESADRPAKPNELVKSDARLFGWNGGVENGPSPIARAGEFDRPLAEIEDLSFGWTRLGLSTNTIHSITLCCDRALCNHKRFLDTVSTDAHTRRVRPDDDVDRYEFDAIRDVTDTWPRRGCDTCVGFLSQDPHHPACGRLTRSARNDIIIFGSVALAVGALGIARLTRRRRGKPL